MPCVRPCWPISAEMFVLGLTGSSAVGKSTAADTFAGSAFRCRCRCRGARAVCAGGAADQPVEAAFPGCTDAGGGIDHAVLGRYMLDDPARRRGSRPSCIPSCCPAQGRFLAHCCAAGCRLVVLDVPLLYETGAERRVDAVAVVGAAAAVQAQRVLRRRAMTAERLAAILRHQLSDIPSKRRHTDFVRSTPTWIHRRRSKVEIAGVIDAARRRPGPRLHHTGSAGGAASERARSRKARCTSG